MTTAKHEETPRRSPAPAGRQTKRPAPVLVAGSIPAAPASERLSGLLDGFADVDALLAGADALLGQHAPPCPRVDAARRALAQAAGLADEARDRADECSLGRFGNSDSADEALRVLALQMDAALSFLAASRDLLEVTDWEASLPLVRAFPLLEIARERCTALAASLRDIRHADLADRVAA